MKNDTIPDKFLNLSVCGATGNTGNLAHGTSCDCMTQQFCVKQSLRFRLICVHNKKFISTVFCLPKTEQKRNLLWHFSKITGKPQPSVNNIMTGDETDLHLPVQPRYEMSNSPTEEFTQSESAYFLTHTQNCEKQLLALSCLSIRLHKWNNSAPTGWIFMKIYIWIFIKNLSRLFKFPENSRRVTGTLHEEPYTFMIIS
jgi:hypothetical protein